jgi:hypothetical protein
MFPNQISLETPQGKKINLSWVGTKKVAAAQQQQQQQWRKEAVS